MHAYVINIMYEYCQMKTDKICHNVKTSNMMK